MEIEPVTVALIPAARAAVAQTAGRLGLSETDVINRAVVAYAFLEAVTEAGADVLVRWESGDTEKVTLL